MTKHGEARKTQRWAAWRSMRERCLNPTHHAWKSYGGRGIIICERWNDYINFAADMGPHPGKGWSLDRIDNNGNYEPGNCRWATNKMQGRNTRVTKLTVDQVQQIRNRYIAGENQWRRGNGTSLAAEFGVHRETISNIVRGGIWA